MIPKRFTLVAGVSESGKSTFAIRYLLNERGIARRLLFDPEGEFAQRLRLPSAGTAAELDKAAMTGWVCFDPGTLFPGQLDRAFDFFCRWALAIADPDTRTCLVVDELWRYCAPSSVSPELATIVQTGRKLGVEGLWLSQRPNRINGTILNELTELVLFRLQEKAGLDKVEEMGADRAAVASLPMGSFIATNLRTGGELRGKLF